MIYLMHAWKDRRPVVDVVPRIARVARTERSSTAEIKKLADTALRELSPVFDAMYAQTGRPSVPPERLLKSLLLIALHSIRSERQFCEQLEYNLLFRWFVDMDMLEEAFDASTFSRN